MQKLKTSPALVPPPPVPPVGRVASASQEPSREPFRVGVQSSFISDVLAELKRVVWPTRNDVCSAFVVTVGLLSFFTVYIYALDAVASAVFSALGLYAK